MTFRTCRWNSAAIEVRQLEKEIELIAKLALRFECYRSFKRSSQLATVSEPFEHECENRNSYEDGPSISEKREGEV